MPNKKYFPKDIEKKWQENWKKQGIYKFSENSKNKYYNLVELPYPSGDLHIGHWFSFVPPDAHARYKRMSGFNVFFPNGFDAFGLPAENAAIKNGVHPKDWTMKNIKEMTKTMSSSLSSSGPLDYGNDPHKLLRATAFHEAGHAVVAYRFGKGVRDPGLSVCRDSPGNGHAALRGVGASTLAGATLRLAPRPSAATLRVTNPVSGSWHSGYCERSACISTCGRPCSISSRSGCQCSFSNIGWFWL